jgi:hypothetical protein
VRTAIKTIKTARKLSNSSKTEKLVAFDETKLKLKLLNGP